MQNSYNENVLLTIQTTLAQYPILSEKIQAEMYNRLIQDGYISFNSFEEHVRDYALLSQKREGLQNPFVQEAQNTWEKRLERVHASQIIQEFAHRYSIKVFERIVKDIVSGNSGDASNHTPTVMWHNLQHATIETIIDQALALERMSLEEQKQYRPQLMGAKVALIRKLISERVAYIRIAKNIFTIHDLIEINRLKIGRGQIGAKAAGVLLASRILRNSEDADIRNAVGKIESICIGADEFYNFMLINDLLGWYDQKYSDEEKLRQDFPKLQEDFEKGEFSPEIVSGLQRMLKEFDGRPFIVRSSDLLEDGFTQPYNILNEGSFIPNQGTPEETLESILNAIRHIYAGVFSPNTLSYLKKNNLLDYPEKMAILIQPVSGNTYGSYFFSDLSGTANGRSPYKWKDSRRKDDGYIRFVLGLTARATRRSGQDYTHIVEFSDPEHRHTTFTENEFLLGQKSILALNLKTNQPVIEDISEIINSSYPAFSYVAQRFDGKNVYSVQNGEECDRFIINCHDLISKTDFSRLMRDILRQLEQAYGCPVHIEFTAMIDTSDPGNPAFRIKIHNCRPVTHYDVSPSQSSAVYPETKRELFSSDLFISDGMINDIDYVIFIDPAHYRKLFGQEKNEFCKILREINRKMADENFIFAAASRWGTEEPNGIPVDFQDISNAKAIIELSGWDEQFVSEPFAGTQFFQGLTESGIAAITTNADKPEYIDRSFFLDSPDISEEWISIPAKYRNSIRIISTRGWYGSKGLIIEMNQNEGLTRASFI